MKTVVKERLAQLPEEPGVYLMKDASGEIIYIGKAKILRNRVRSYFQKSAKDHRAAELLRPLVCDIEWIITPTELDALLLEANLVGKHQPRYNVRLKDDKHFPYLMVTWNEAFPRLKVVRKTRDDGNAYFGPYVNVRAMRKVLEVMPKVFQVRECDLQLPLKKPDRPCLSYHIGRCDGPCAELCTKSEYRAKIEDLENFLRGQFDVVADRLRQQMLDASARMDFERAAKYRDQLQALDSLNVKQNIDRLDDKVDRDYVAMERLGDLATLVLMEYRDGQLLERKSYTVRCPLEEDGDLVTSLLIKHYEYSAAYPREIHLDKNWEGLELIEEYLRLHAPRVVKMIVPKIGDKKRILLMAKRNAHMLLGEAVQKAAKAQSIEESVEMLQRLLDLPRLPRRIEGYDISHLGGTQTVASGVCFINGRASKENYRRYKVETVEWIDDFASMREVLGRRFRRLLEEEDDEPDLILIDGGKGQLRAAYEVMQEAGIDIPMIGLAKRIEEVFFPGSSVPVLLDHSTSALKLLQRVRDEAHRFALTYQRQRREQKMVTLALLEGVAGLGKQSLSLLRKRFGTEQMLRAASLEEIEDCVGARRARIVQEVLFAKDA